MKLAVLAAAFLAAASVAQAGPSMCGGAKSTSAEAPIQTPSPTS
ncbi:MAG: hypothetical protein ACFCUS_08800 [Rubrimonas sp.]